MEKTFFSTRWKQKSNEWLSKAILDTEKLRNVETEFINREIKYFFEKFNHADTDESEWYNEYIATDENVKIKFETIANNAKITTDNVSFLPISLKYSLGLLTGIIVMVITKCLGVTIFRSLLIGAFAGIMVHYFIGNFQNKANKRKAKTLTDNVKRQLEETHKNIIEQCNLN